ncbi:MAG TPA: MarR family transcriptional regulator [Candidatus Deferrimicrobium sp.]|nr:MarR family transcriptional regulator [Candidatus Deferrimicrobium sp.]
MSNDEASIRRNISTLYRYGQAYIARRIESTNIGSGQYIFLTTLYRMGGVSQEELSCYLQIDKGTTAKAIKKLEAGGYLVREIDLKDKRAYKIFLTQKGLDLVPTIQAEVEQWEKLITSGISDEEKKCIERILHKMAHNAHNLNKSRGVSTRE